MKRLLVLLSVVAAAALVVLVTQPFTAAGYRVDAIFDTANGISSGMNVEVAGVPEGTVVGVALTGGMKARVELRLNRRFAPFHTDARCQILPEGIISENYVECDPGSSQAPPLPASGAGAPTVPLAHDSTPVSLQQFIDIFSVPVADRLQLLLDELGISTAGRGEDLNQILRRANPSLSQANRVLATVDAQRAQLADAIVQTNAVMAQLAARRQSVRRFVDEAAATAELTAQHRGALAAAINRLPAFLSQARRTSDTLHGLSGGAIPLLSALRADGPALSELTRTVPGFTAAAEPAVQALSTLSVTGRRALAATRPAAVALSRFTAAAPSTIALLDRFLTNVQSRGGIEYALDLFYGLAVAPAPFDATSHVITLNAIVTPCLTTPTAAGCNRGWSSTASREAAGGAAPAAARAAALRSPARRSPQSAPPSRSLGVSGRPAASTPASTPPAGPPAPGVSSAPPSPTRSAQSLLGLLGYLIK